MTGLVAGAAGAGTAGAVDGLVAGADWVFPGFAAGVGPEVVGLDVGVPLDVDGAVEVAGAAWVPPLVGRFGVTCDGPAGRPPVPTSTTFRDGR